LSPLLLRTTNREDSTKPAAYIVNSFSICDTWCLLLRVYYSKRTYLYKPTIYIRQLLHQLFILCVLEYEYLSYLMLTWSLFFNFTENTEWMDMWWSLVTVAPLNTDLNFHSNIVGKKRLWPGTMVCLCCWSTVIHLKFWT
jgi:hypothetical protein